MLYCRYKCSYSVMSHLWLYCIRALIQEVHTDPWQLPTLPGMGSKRFCNRAGWMPDERPPSGCGSSGQHYPLKWLQGWLSRCQPCTVMPKGRLPTLPPPSTFGSTAQMHGLAALLGVSRLIFTDIQHARNTECSIAAVQRHHENMMPTVSSRVQSVRATNS
jgi:hypothetical protein